MHRKEVNYKIVYILDSKLYTSNITDLVQQMLIDSAMLMISIAFFVSGSARGSNGSGGGDNSAAIEKINQFEVTKTNDEAKIH
jgi:hypothetical protein